MDEETTNLPDNEIPDDAAGAGVENTNVPDDDGAGLLGDPQPQDDGQAQSQQDDDTEEVEHDGKKFRIPKELKSALMMQADYTRKTQELAEQRRTAEAERTRFAQANQEHIQGVARLVAMDEQIEAFNKVDWKTLSDNDPVQAQQAWMQFSQLKDARQQMAVQLQQQEQQRALEMQQVTAKQIEESQAVLARDIKGWSPQMAQQLTQFAAKEYGFQPQELAQVYDPRVVKLLHSAWMGSELMKKQMAATQKPAGNPAKPVPQVGSGAAPAGKDPTRMSDAEWLESRMKSRAKR